MMLYNWETNYVRGKKGENKTSFQDKQIIFLHYQVVILRLFSLHSHDLR